MNEFCPICENGITCWDSSSSVVQIYACEGSLEDVIMELTKKRERKPGHIHRLSIQVKGRTATVGRFVTNRFIDMENELAQIDGYIPGSQHVHGLVIKVIGETVMVDQFANLIWMMQSGLRADAMGVLFESEHTRLPSNVLKRIETILTSEECKWYGFRINLHEEDARLLLQCIRHPNCKLTGGSFTSGKPRQIQHERLRSLVALLSVKLRLGVKSNIRNLPVEMFRLIKNMLSN
jgi:hypothetical protein